MLETLLIVLLAAGWSVTGVLYVFRIRDARNTIEFLSDGQAEAQDLRIEAERGQQAAETELNFLRQTLQGLISRPAIAMVTDQHIQNFASIVMSIVHPDSEIH
jgi:hypothetical protein